MDGSVEVCSTVGDNLIQVIIFDIEPCCLDCDVSTHSYTEIRLNPQARSS